MVSLAFKNVQLEGRRDVLGKVKCVKVWLGHAEGIERKTDYVIGDRIEGKEIEGRELGNFTYFRLECFWIWNSNGCKIKF